MDLIFNPGSVIITRRHRAELESVALSGLTAHNPVVSLYNWLPIKVVYVPSGHCNSSYKAALDFYIWRISRSAECRLYAVVSEICDRSGPCQLSVLMETMRSVGPQFHSKTNTARGLHCRLNRISRIIKPPLTLR